MSRQDAKIIGVDTNIYLDYLLKRKYAKQAWVIFSRAIQGEFRIVVSKWLSVQLLHHLSPESIKGLFTLLESSHAIIWVNYTNDDIEEAKRYSTGNDIDDPMHAIIARKGGAKIIVTRDLDGFTSCKSFIEAKLPESL